MRTVQRSALVPYSAAQMFALVDDVESYPDFLPWCKSAEVHSRGEDTLEASIEMQRGKISKKFRTRNANDPPRRIDIALVDGPFRHLQGRWVFEQLNDAGSKVELNLSFEFASSTIDVVLGRFFENTCNSLIEAFSRRADELYGGPSS